MAVKSKNGTVLLQYSKESPVAADASINWQRTTWAVMSNGKVLTKRDVRFKADSFSGERLHTWGWKVAGKTKADLNLSETAAALKAKGFTIETEPALAPAE